MFVGILLAGYMCVADFDDFDDIIGERDPYTMAQAISALNGLRACGMRDADVQMLDEADADFEVMDLTPAWDEL